MTVLYALVWPAFVVVAVSIFALVVTRRDQAHGRRQRHPHPGE